MKHRNTRRYAVKTSIEAHAVILASHCRLPDAYRSYVKAHKAHYRHHRFILAQTPIAIISSEVDKDIILADIHEWATQDRGSPSRQRLPMPIIVHQWNHAFNIYVRLVGAKS